MRLSTKIILLAWTFLFLIVGSLIYSAYSKLNPESLITLLNFQVQKNYPGSQLSIAKIDYGFSLDFDLSMKDLTLKREEKILAQASEVQLKVPWWLILLNRGSAQLNISDMVIFVTSSSAKIKNEEEDRNPEKKTHPIEITLPQYLLDAHYTLRARNLSIKEMDGDRRFFTLSKLLVREFQYGKNSAFELNIPISISHKQKKFNSELWLFGDVTPNISNWSLNYRGELKTKESIDRLQFDDLVIDGKSTFNPMAIDLKSTIDLSIERKKVGSGTITAKYEKLNFEVNFSEFPVEYLSLIGDEIRNPFWNKNHGVAEGDLKFNRDFSNEANTFLSAKLNFPGTFTVGKDAEFEGKWNLNFENEKWETSFITPKGEITFSRRAVIDFEKGEIKQYSQEIGLNSLEMKTALLAIQSLPDLLKMDLTSFHSTVISLAKCTDGEKVLAGSFRYGISPFEKFYQVDLQSSDSKFVLNYLHRPTSQQMNMEASHFAWNSNYQFLAPYFKATEGIVNGKINGAWSSNWNEGKWIFNLKLNGAKDLNGQFFELTQKAWDLFGIDTIAYLDRSWNFTIDKNLIKINSLSLEGSDLVNLTGNLSSRPKTKSYLVLNYPKNKKWKPVKKEVNEFFWIKENE